jgi:UDP-GlcNAc:undecaprenyl-phosphate GlcNAc-1-phosphate transferase
MITWLPFFCLALSAFATCVALTPIVRGAAARWGLVDRPDAHRKIHGRTTPLGGGVAVLISTFAAICLAMFVPGILPVDSERDPKSLIGLGLAAVVLCLVGLIDDARSLRARQKFAGQVLASTVLMASGLVIQGVQIFDWHIELGLLAWPFTLFWLLGAINSVNLIDGADGLATTVGIILSGALGTMALMAGQDLEALVAFTLMGSLIGFLVFNFPPASIFLGDAGSMLIGLLTGALAIRCCLKSSATFAMAAPIAIWAIPAFDCGIAIIRRKLTGRGISSTDRGHLHHCLLRRGFGSRQMLCWVASLCLVTVGGAILSQYFHREIYAFASVVAVVTLLILTRIFGHSEFLLVTDSLRNLSASLISPAWRTDRAAQRSTVRLQGTRPWESLWDLLLEAAPTLNLCRMRLNMNLPWLHESYHASWKQDPTCEPHHIWNAEIPLNVGGRQVGQLSISGQGDQGQMAIRIAKFVELLETIEDRLGMLLTELPQNAPGAAASDGSVAGEPSVVEPFPRQPSGVGPLTAHNV